MDVRLAADWLRQSRRTCATGRGQSHMDWNVSATWQSLVRRRRLDSELREARQTHARRESPQPGATGVAHRNMVIRRSSGVARRRSREQLSENASETGLQNAAQTQRTYGSDCRTRPATSGPARTTNRRSRPSTFREMTVRNSGECGYNSDHSPFASSSSTSLWTSASSTPIPASGSFLKAFTSDPSRP